LADGSTYRLGCDVGGTFTDLLLIEEASGRTFRTKLPSTPDDPSEAILDGVQRVCALAGTEPARVAQLMHGTTVATNAVLEGRGARVGLVVTEGYRQILHVARSFVPGGLAGWITWPKPEPLVDLEDTVEVVERVGAHGDVVTPLDEAGARAALERLRAAGVEAVTVSLINAYVNDAHERRIGELCAQLLPGVPVSLSSEILREIREYERTMTTVANAYVRPTVARYLANLRERMQARRIPARLQVLRSDGGLMDVEPAADAPVNLLMSGPAGGVNGAVWVGRQAGFENLLTLDMGGTSTDVSLIEGGQARVTRQTEVGDLAVRASSVDVRTVGAGGGSIAHVPELTRALRVGPRSAGSQPGPAAYGRGGTDPTVTDANVVLGYLPEALLGGEMRLDVDAARAAVEGLARELGLELRRAAAGIVDIVNENMFGALRLVSVQQGYDPRDFALVAFGGAGPLHANALGRLTGAWPVIVPPSPGVLNAYGDATTRQRSDASATYIRELATAPRDDVGRTLEALAEWAAAALAGTAGERERTVAYEVDVRYQGQGFELSVPLGVEEWRRDGLRPVGERFDAEHERLFSFTLDAPHEIVNLRAVVLGPQAEVAIPELEAGGPDPAPARVRETAVWIDDREQPATIYDRERLRAGNRIAGPAIVTEMDSTTLVLPDHLAEVDRFGNLLISPAR
jgi:N-methylhydantoinase A